MKFTSRFNLGYWYEQKSQFAEADDVYKSILKDEPTYLDAYLRLAYMARDRGAEQKAFEVLEQAKKNATRQLPVY